MIRLDYSVHKLILETYITHKMVLTVYVSNIIERNLFIGKSIFLFKCFIIVFGFYTLLYSNMIYYGN